MRLTRFIAAVVTCTLAMAALPAVAGAAGDSVPTWQVGGDDHDHAVDVSGQANGSDGGGAAPRSSGGWRLLYVETGDRACDPNHDGVADPIYVYMTPAGDVVQVCSDPTPPPPVPRFFAEETSRQMPLPFAGVHMSPPEGRDQLVNLATWLWVDNWAPVSTSATLRNVTVTVTATPDSVVWDMGTGDAPVVCGAGRPYDPTVAADRQQTDCSFTYRRSSFGQADERFHGSATMRWTVTWVSSTGDSGSLPGLSSSPPRPFAVRVTEGEAVVTDAR